MRILFCSLILAAALPGAGSGQFQHFLKARGDRLMDGDAELRFVSYNIPNLHYIEDDHRFDRVNPWRIADEFEIRDALETIAQAGGNVTRMYVPSVRKAIDDSSIVRHVLAPGIFNEDAFRAYDRVLQVANQTGVRVIIPLVDNWWWWGGPKEYAAFRGKTKDEFWTDSLLIADFKKTVAFLVTRVNTITGVRFSDDKAVFGWETGNEIVAPYQWTRTIAAYIKSLDSNHLVIEGTFSREISDEALADPNIDVLSTHHYTPARETIPAVIAAREKARGKKPYFVGEFGFIPTAEMKQILDTVVASGISGIMVWSLRTHNRDGGFYYHENAYRWPGFPSGDAWDERNVTRLFREEAARVNGNHPAAASPPATPSMILPESPWKISWQGAAGASSYLIERKAEEEGFWQVITPRASDADIGYRPLYADTTARPGVRYFYRIRARNEAGYSDLSEPVGPVSTPGRMLIDEMGDSSAWYTAEGIQFVPLNDVAKANEDRTRIGGSTGAYIVYRLRGAVTAWQVDVFDARADADTSMRFFAGASADSLTPLPVRRTVYEPLRNEYGAYTCVRLGGAPQAGGAFVKIVLAAGCQVGRVELAYAVDR